MLGSLLSIGGALASGLSKPKKDAASQQLSGFAALPKEVQDVYLQNFLPRAVEATNLPYQGIPMERVGAPQSIFDSEGLWKLQQYSDSIGGLFSPTGAGGGQQGGGGAPQRQSSSVTLAQLLPYLASNVRGFTGDQGRAQLGQALMQGQWGDSPDQIVEALKRAYGSGATGTRDQMYRNFFGGDTSGSAVRALLGV